MFSKQSKYLLYGRAEWTGPAVALSIRRFRTPVPVSMLTQSGPDFLGLDQNCIQVQITGCHKEINKRLILIKVECIYS